MAIPNCKHHGCSSRVSTVILKRLGGLNKASLDYFRGTRFYRTPQMHCSSSCPSVAYWTGRGQFLRCLCFLQHHNLSMVNKRGEAGKSSSTDPLDANKWKWLLRLISIPCAMCSSYMATCCFHPCVFMQLFRFSINLLSLPSPPHRRVASTNVSSDTQGALNHMQGRWIGAAYYGQKWESNATARVEHGLNIQMHLIRQSFNLTQSNPNAFDHLLPAGVAESTLVFFAHLWVFLPCWFCAWRYVLVTYQQTAVCASPAVLDSLHSNRTKPWKVGPKMPPA